MAHSSLKLENLFTTTALLVPFLEHNEPARLQMAGNHLRQVIPLAKSDVPYIYTGYENNIIYHYTRFIVCATRPGILRKLHDTTWMIIDPETDEYDLIYIDKDLVRTNKLQDNTFVTEHDLLAYHPSYLTYIPDLNKDSKIPLRQYYFKYGVNLLTACTSMYHLTFQDMIAISESAVEKLASARYVTHPITLSYNSTLDNLYGNKQEYKPLPEIGTRITSDKPYIVLKVFDRGFATNTLLPIYADGIIKNYRLIIADAPHEHLIPLVEFVERIGGEVISLRYKDLSTTKLRSIEKTVVDIPVRNESETKEEYVDRLTEWAKHLTYGLDTLGKSSIPTSNDVILEITLELPEPLMLSDKMTNRHGNKGVVNIVPEKYMPKTEDGRTIEIVFNPLSVPSRMNLGQEYEIEIARYIHCLSNVIKQYVDNNDIEKARTLIKEIADAVYCNDKYFRQYSYVVADNITIDQLKKILDSIGHIPVYIRPLHSPGLYGLNKLAEIVKKYVNDEFAVMGKTRLEYTLGSRTFKTMKPVTVGYMYWLRLLHSTWTKLTATGFGPYNKMNQPVEGQRMGEMEFWNIIAHSAYNLFNELNTARADDFTAKHRLIAKELGIEDKLQLGESDDKEMSFTSTLKQMLGVLGFDVR